MGLKRLHVVLALSAAISLGGCRNLAPSLHPSALVSSASASTDCKVEENAQAVKDAARSLPEDPGWQARYVPQGASNYNPCATLSGATVLPEGSTGYGPYRILLFHKGEYVGTATLDGYRDSFVDVAESTDDTVAVVFRWPVGNECHACETGVGHARFAWVDGKVKQLDPIPAGALPWKEAKPE